jgi:hypothetical protein
MAGTLLFAAACASEQTSSSLPPVTAASTTTSTSTTTTVVATTAPVTTAVETTTTDPPPPPTEPPPPADVVTPYFAGGDSGGGWIYLGGHDATGWTPPFTEAGTPIDPAVAPGTPLVVSRLGVAAQPATSGEYAETCFDGRVGPTLDVSVAAPDPPGFGYSAVALQAAWALRPRPVISVAAPPPSYQAAGESIFAGDPVDATQGRVVQTVVADLDGDDDEEAIVVFEYIQPSIVGAPGDLAAVFAIDTASGAVTEIDANFVDPLLPAEQIPLIGRYRVIDVADLDADGTMEVVLHSWYYEGATVYAYNYDGASYEAVIGTGCGS